MKVLLFDGECNLCNGAVQFILKRDRAEVIKFASLQSRAGEELVKEYNVPNNINSIVYITNGKVYTKSDAALHISRELGKFWRLAYSFIWIPKPIRDKLYDYIAKNRYKWFGKTESCMIPTPELKKRFL